jgi:UDP-glucose-4-epimerase GalE
MSILITGGAGFIGSHTAKLLADSGFEVVVLDNFAIGRRENARWGVVVEGNCADTTLVRAILRKYSVKTVLHLAASAHVGESMASPDAYFANNVCGTLKLLDAMIAEDVMQFVFASSCSVYGNSPMACAREDEVITPVSPYGESKLQTERILPWYQRAYGLRWAALRYFNVAGAAEGLGEEIFGSVRIIPRVVQSAVGSGPVLEVFGTSFPTEDGSVIRDFVHIDDVTRANLKALRFVQEGPAGEVINIGSGEGVSVLQIIEAVSRKLGQDIPYYRRPARPGDPACAISNIFKAEKLLGWTPVASSLGNIVASVISSSQVRSRS